MIGRYVKVIISVCANVLSNFLGYHLTYVVESYDWSIKNDGQSITSTLNKQGLLRARISYSSIGLRNQIVHFGSVNTFFRKGRWRTPHASNKVMLTWFHVVPNDDRLVLIKEAQSGLCLIHTSCAITKCVLIDAGVEEHKIVVIPLGVDLTLFTLVNEDKKRAARRQFGILMDRLVIGSFQKDGIGWDEGLEPKLIKGPDIFIEVMGRIKNFNPFVLLAGPARGYVKRALQKQGIEYKHIYVKNFQELPALYHALDLYLITSRVEGGPKSLLEAWASGIPLVATRVGMVADAATNEHDCLLAQVEDCDTLAEHTTRIIEHDDLRNHLIIQGQKSVQQYNRETLIYQYWEKLYQPLSTILNKRDKNIWR